MKKLDIKTGGHRNSADDLVHLHEIINEGLTAAFVASLDTNKNYILKGCQIIENDDGDLQNTPGLILHQGEVFQVDASIVPHDGNPGWNLDESHRPGNPLTYASGAKHSPHVIRKLKLMGDTPEILHRDLWHAEVAQGVEEGIVAGFDLKKAQTNALIFNADRSGKAGKTEIIFKGKRWEVTDDILVIFYPPLSNGIYQNETHYIYCEPGEMNTRLYFKTTRGQVPTNALLLGKVVLNDGEDNGWNVQQIYGGNPEDNVGINLETYKTRNRLVKYFPLSQHASRPSEEGWVRIAEPIKKLIDAKLQSLYAEVVFDDGIHPFRVSLFGYLSFLSARVVGQELLSYLVGNLFSPQSTKRLPLKFYRSFDNLDTYQWQANAAGSLSYNALTTIDNPNLANQENNTKYFIGIDATYYI